MEILEISFLSNVNNYFGYRYYSLEFKEIFMAKIISNDDLLAELENMTDANKKKVQNVFLCTTLIAVLINEIQNNSSVIFVASFWR